MTSYEQLQYKWRKAEAGFYTGNRIKALAAQIRCAFAASTLQMPHYSVEEMELQQHRFRTRLVPYLVSPKSSLGPGLIVEIFERLWSWKPIRHETQRRGFLRGMLRYLPATERNTILEMLLAIPTSHHYHDFVALLRQFPTYLTPTHIHRILQATLQSHSEAQRSELLACLAPYLEPHQLSEAWNSAQTLQHVDFLPSAIGAVALRLSNDVWETAFPQLLTIESERVWANALVAVLSRLSATELETTRLNAFMMQDQHACKFLLSNLIKWLSPEKRAVLYAELVNHPLPSLLQSLFPTFARYMPAHWHPEAIKRMEILGYPPYRCVSVLMEMALHLEGEAKVPLWRQVIEVARQERDLEDRVELFTKILKQVEGSLRITLLTHILDELHQIDPAERSDLWVELAWVLQQDEFDVLLTAFPLLPLSHQADAIARTAYTFPDALLPQVMARVRTHKEHLWYGQECEQMATTLATWATRTPDAAYEVWKANLHAFAELSPIALLTFIANMLPFAMALVGDNAPQLSVEIYSVVLES